MMSNIHSASSGSPQVNYAKMRAALELFDKPLAELSTSEYQQMLQQVNREMAIAKRILETREASDVLITDAVIQRNADTLMTRFDSEEAFHRALQDNELDYEGLLLAVEQELRVEAVLEKVLSRNVRVSEEETEIYYYQHLERFELPETRTVRHILITINEAFPENHFTMAEKRLAKIRAQIVKGGEPFAALAGRHSECPSAMHQGLLGRIKPGQLYPQLDQVLFAMQEGEVSDIVSSPVGLHLLYCEQIHKTQQLEYAEVREKLHEHLENKKRKYLLREWLKQPAAEKLAIEGRGR
jgi:nitrogen fixation protein NifM